MSDQRIGDKAVGHIAVDPQPKGAVAVYLVETENDAQTRSLMSLFEDLKPHIEVRQLSRGKLVSYAVLVKGVDPSVLDELERALRSDYSFVVMQRSFDEIIYRVVTELCSDTKSKLLPIPRCNICGKTEPFPDTLVTLADERGEPIMSRNYCGACTAGLIARTNKDFVQSLLLADTKDFRGIANSNLVRSYGRKHYLRYKVKS